MHSLPLDFTEVWEVPEEYSWCRGAGPRAPASICYCVLRAKIILADFNFAMHTGLPSLA